MESSTLYNSSSSAPKMERKYIEKNRRCQMKTLYFNLTSLLPRQYSKEGLALPDKIDEAVKYIQTLQLELEKYKDKKEKLMSRKREHSCMTNDTIKSTMKAPPHFEIQEMGPDLDMVLVNGLDDSFISFNEIIRVLHQQGAEVVQASFSNTGNSVFHILHPKEGLALPDKIDEAVKYIQTLQLELEKYKDKKEKLMSRKREHSCMTNDTIKSTMKAPPHFEIQEMGPDLDMVLVNGLDDSFISFNEIIRVLHQQGAEVVQASFSNTGNSVFHILHPKSADPTLRSQATANISTRLNELIYGTSSSYFELESKLDIWDFEILDFKQYY